MSFGKVGRGLDFESFLKEACGPLDLRWKKYRRRAVRRRVLDRIRELGLGGYAAYLEVIERNPGEAAGLADRMRVTVSRFFRERPYWEELMTTVLPLLVAGQKKPRELRVWSAGCCGGEEPYSMAILYLDQLRARFPGLSIDILATDIDLPSLKRAEQALYLSQSLREVPEELKERWFRRVGNGWRLKEEVIRLVRFESRNLMIDPPPQPVDLVLCRYLVFTYYQGGRRQAAARRLWTALRPGGALMIGRKEGLGRKEAALFAPWPGTEKIFRAVKPAEKRRFRGKKLPDTIEGENKIHF